MTATRTRYAVPALGGDRYLLVVVGDVVALPDANWSGQGYGSSISVEWMLHSGRLPRHWTATKRAALARVVVVGLWRHHHGDEPVPSHLLELT